MAWLTYIPNHYMGIYGIFIFFFLLYYQPNLVNKSADRPINADYKRHKINTDTDNGKVMHIVVDFGPTSHYSFSFYLSFSIFIVSMFYTASFLPYGRFFHEIGGNFGLGLSYIYIYLYLAFPSYRAGSDIFKRLIY